MAECLSPKYVEPKRFGPFFLKNDVDKNVMLEALDKAGYEEHVNVRPNMFVKAK